MPPHGFDDDDPFADDGPGKAIELDLPPPPPPPPPAQAPARRADLPDPEAAAPAPPAPPLAPAEPSAFTKAAIRVAKYPAPPARRREEPLYACKVLVRQLELRLDLDSLRRKRSPDLALYEEALRVHDAPAFRRGLTVVGAAFAVFLVLFFMPVILRFTRS